MKDSIASVPAIRTLIASGIALGSLFSLAGLFGADWYLFSLAVHWSIHTGTVAILIGLYFGFALRRYSTLIILVFLGTVQIFLPLQSVLFNSRRHHPEMSELKVLHLNLNHLQDDPSGIEILIVSSDADVIFLHELTESIWESLVNVRQIWRHNAAMPRPDYFGTAVLSRVPLSRSDFIEVKPGSVAVPIISIASIESPHSIISPHFLAPSTAEKYRMQREQFHWLAMTLQQMPPTTMVIGDFNTTPWHRDYVELLKTSELSDSRSGFGIFPTWPSLMGVAGIPIDLAAYRGGFRINGIQTVEIPRSDHRGLLIFASINSEKN